jgi:acyl carrier protein
MRDRIKSIIADVLKIEIDDDISQTSCAEWDSMHHLNLIFELEMAFNISIEPEEIMAMQDINSIELIIKTKLYRDNSIALSDGK